MNTKEINSLVLAYIGDAIWEIIVRKQLILQKIANVNDLQKESIKYVSAKSQSDLLEELLTKDFFNEEELDIYKRARNHKGAQAPKSTDIVTYKRATGFEAIIGYWYLENKNNRLEDLTKEVF